MTETDEILTEMLLTNTGRAMCDSGGTPEYDKNGKYVGSSCGYGRHFERNQGRDFASEPAAGVSFRFGIEYWRSTFHYLRERLEYWPEMQRIFEAFEKLNENEHKYWLQLMEEFPKWLQKKGWVVSEMWSDNTYNGECTVDQVLQYVECSIIDERNEYRSGRLVLLQIHQGCDVRGGYTAPKCFIALSGDYFAGDDAHGYIRCTNTKERFNELMAELRQNAIETLDETQLTFMDSNGRLSWSIPMITVDILDKMEFLEARECEVHAWATDDSYNWYKDLGGYISNEGNLKDYEMINADEVDGWEWTPNVLWFESSTGVGYCPICGAPMEAI